MEITIDNIKDIKKNRIHKGYIALFYSNSCGHCVHFMPIWETLKKKLSKEYQFLELEYSNMQKLDKDYNIKFSQVKYFPYICVYSPNEKKHIEYNERTRNEENLTKFIKSYLSQLLPNELTYDNINNYLIKATKYHKKGFILLVYWKDCHYCIEFMPMWEELKKKYNDRVQFFQLERNELDKVRDNITLLNDVKSFPSIMIYDNDNKRKINYEDERSMNKLSKFIETYLI